ncbi:MAG: helix-turn-helix transcriptional regulator [Fibrobacter sp.]|nr:helix-turn-helix transcriptional regulator [Fibrobacter sp.]MBR5412583.1 helix-turn-helix transcriptional regulator [Fibrobacter sp.]
MKLKSDEEKAFDIALSKILKTRRDKLKLSQEFISFHSGVTRITIGKWERGVKTPISFDLYNVLKVLYKEPSEFWTEFYKEYEAIVAPIHEAAEKEKLLKYFEQSRKKRNAGG